MKNPLSKKIQDLLSAKKIGSGDLAVHNLPSPLLPKNSSNPLHQLAAMNQEHKRTDSTETTSKTGSEVLIRTSSLTRSDGKPVT